MSSKQKSLKRTGVKPARSPVGKMHPGYVLQYSFMRPLELTSYRLAKELGEQQGPTSYQHAPCSAAITRVNAPY